MRIFIQVCLMMLVLLAGGCATHNYPVKNIYELKCCKLKCKTQYEKCNHACHNSCAECKFRSNQTTAKTYRRFLHEQRVQGGIISRELNSYRDPLQCHKNTCNCVADYKVCEQACEGKIHKRLQVPPICC